jgi:hypothetical protein
VNEALISGAEQEGDAQKMAAALILGPDHKVINMAEFHSG